MVALSCIVSAWLAGCGGPPPPAALPPPTALLPPLPLLLAAFADPAGFLPARFAWKYSHSKPRFWHRLHFGLPPVQRTLDDAQASQLFLRAVDDPDPSDVLRRFGRDGPDTGDVDPAGG